MSDRHASPEPPARPVASHWCRRRRSQIYARGGIYYEFFQNYNWFERPSGFGLRRAWGPIGLYQGTTLGQISCRDCREPRTEVFIPDAIYYAPIPDLTWEEVLADPETVIFMIVF